MRKTFICCAAALLAMASFSACSSRVEENLPAGARAAVVATDESSLMRETVLFADPQGAADAVYASLDGERAITKVEAAALEDALGVDPANVESFVAYTSDPKKGLCDLAIILPKEGRVEEVRDALNEYRALRTEQFKNYDILSSYTIAQSATVFNQGDYVILLMLPDNEAAQELIDQHMPQ